MDNQAHGFSARTRYFCSPQHTNSAFYPIIGQIECAAGIVQDDGPSAKLDKLDVLLSPSLKSAVDAEMVL